MSLQFCLCWEAPLLLAGYLPNSAVNYAGHTGVHQPAAAARSSGWSISATMLPETVEETQVLTYENLSKFPTGGFDQLELLIAKAAKRQWAANFHLQYNDHKSWKEPAKLFENMVVVGLHPNSDIQALQKQYLVRRSEGSGKLRSALGYHSLKVLFFELHFGVLNNIFMRERL
ncbi:hypothetical protein KIW84_014470 [Lathyrus oleraceus]|uniref:Uncharacterized protein n=1 Tax=Pisum sativum TaxID=3888 RepID=A0A9D5BMR3_PEA|nr:hypothetical protein KIW84_014470 [Pisum sativum]